MKESKESREERPRTHQESTPRDCARVTPRALRVRTGLLGGPLIVSRD